MCHGRHVGIRSNVVDFLEHCHFGR
jgi:hypothetical protein